MTPYKGPHNFKTQIVKSVNHLLNISKAGFVTLGKDKKSKRIVIIAFLCPHFAFEGREYIIIQSGKRYLLFEAIRD